MSGDRALDQEYVLARRVLLDALDALADHRQAVVLVGAQAVYHHTGSADLAVAEHTTDGDLALDPASLQPLPRLEDALRTAGFELLNNDVGSWSSALHELNGRQVRIKLDLMVPEQLGGPGSRGARLGGHGNRAARKAKGLEAALVDHATTSLTALDPADRRSTPIAVAGPAALLVAKVHKIQERLDDPRRSKDKDALDVFRLLRVVPTDRLADGLQRLCDDALAGQVSREARGHFAAIFGGRPGPEMVSRALEGTESANVIRASVGALAADLVAALR